MDDVKKYLVTGGAGFIGANFVKYLLGRYGSGVEILVLDALTYAGNLLTIAEELKSGNVGFVKGDIGDRELVSRLMREFNPDYVVNFAAESHVDRSISNARVFLETNILGTHNLLECVREAWAEGKDGSGKTLWSSGKKFIQISTDEVYGSLPRREGAPQPLVLSKDVAGIVSGRSNLVCFGDGFFTETTPVAPRSPYSTSKASADLLALAFHETYGVPVCITRCSNNYGPYQFPEKLIPLVINNVLEGRRLPVYGKGDNVRDWLYVTDHCKAIDLVARRGKVGEIYNVGGFNEQENINIVKMIISLVRDALSENPDFMKRLKVPFEQVNASMISYVADRPGHDMRYAINPEKIAKELGWYPETCFEDGIRMTIRWYLENGEWVDNVTSGAYREYYREKYGE